MHCNFSFKLDCPNIFTLRAVAEFYFYFKTNCLLLILMNSATGSFENIGGHYQYTGSSRLMQISLVWISLLRLFKKFHKYLPNAIFGLFYFISAIFGQKKPKNSTNEIVKKSHKANFWLMWILANANFSQNQKSH